MVIATRFKITKTTQMAPIDINDSMIAIRAVVNQR